MRPLLFVTVLLVTSGPVSGQTARVPASATLARAFGLIAPDVGGQAVRTDVTATADGLILRVTPSDAATEWSPTRARTARAVTATVRYDAEARLAALEVVGTLRDAPDVRVSVSASDAERTTALASARLATEGALVGYARARPWPGLGTVTVEAVALAWTATTERTTETPVWTVELTATRGTTPVRYRATLAAADGRLVTLTREEQSCDDSC